MTGVQTCALPISAGLWTLVFIIAYKDQASANIWAGDISRITIMLMAALWLWSGLSILWTLSADLTWNEFNRTGAYLAILIIGIYTGRTHGARRLTAFLFMIIVTMAALYGLGVKLFPSLLDNYDNLARISVPIGYVNAQGLLVAMAVPLTLLFSTSGEENSLLRLTSTLCAPVLLLCLFFTLSRGATVALLSGMIVFFSLTPMRLRAFSVLVLISVPTGLIAAWSNGQGALMENRVEQSLREAAAAPLRLYLVMALLVAGIVFMLALAAGKKVRFSQGQRRLAGAALISAVTVMLIAGSVMFIRAQPSLEVWARDTYQDVITTNSSGPGASRLLSVGAARRWQIWQEALSAWREHPLAGSGAQSFPIIHLLNRESGMPFVKQPHGLPFRLLSEEGLVGFAIAGAFIVVTLISTALLLMRIDDRWKRGLAGADRKSVV